jgi:nicotinamidase-related amidase
MDYQNVIFGFLPDTAPLVPRMQAVRAAAKAKGVQIVYVQVGFRPGYPEVSDRNPAFTMVRDNGILALGNEDQQIHPDLAPEADDVVVTKRRYGPFYSTDLDQILRVKGIDTLVFAGIATSGVVLTGVRNAADMDYRVVVLSDCCGDGDEEVHRVLLEKVFPAQAVVTTSDEWLAGLA